MKCSEIPISFWEPLLTGDPEISKDDFARRLAKDEKLWCRENLIGWLTVRKAAMVRTLAARESVRAHWDVAVNKQFGVKSVAVYPTRVPVTSPLKLFRFWTSMLSWAACEKCGRRDASLWKRPCLKNGDWDLPVPALAAAITCGHHAFWQQRCARPVDELEQSMSDMRAPKWLPSPELKGVDTFVSLQCRHWPVWDGSDYVDAKRRP